TLKNIFQPQHQQWARDSNHRDFYRVPFVFLNEGEVRSKRNIGRKQERSSSEKSKELHHTIIEWRNMLTQIFKYARVKAKLVLQENFVCNNYKYNKGNGKQRDDQQHFNTEQCDRCIRLFDVMMDILDHASVPENS